MTIKRTLIISIACGLMAIILSALYLHLKEIEVAGGGELLEVLVAADDINSNTLIEPGLLRTQKVPRVFIQPGAIRDVRETLGRISIAGIKRGEQLMGTKLVIGGPKSGLSFKVPSGKRAVSIPVDDAKSAGGLLQPDDHVDVIVTFDYGEKDKADKYTYTLFQNVEVLAVGSSVHSMRKPEGIAIIEKESKDMFGSVASIGGVKSSTSVVTLALDPDEAQRLIFANDTGTVTLALRSPMDRLIDDDTEPVKVDTLTGRSGFTRKSYKEYRGQ